MIVDDKPSWLNRDAMPLQVHYCLVLSQEAFNAKHTEIGTRQQAGNWLPIAKASAACHPFYDKDGALHVIVAFRPTNRPGLEVAALLCHEAVHIWQFHCDEVGEKQSVGDEHMAWSIQHIVSCLMWSYQQQMKL